MSDYKKVDNSDRLAYSKCSGCNKYHTGKTCTSCYGGNKTSRNYQYGNYGNTQVVVVRPQVVIVRPQVVVVRPRVVVVRRSVYPLYNGVFYF